MTSGLSRQWPSLADQIDAAEVCYGESGQRRVAAWLDEQLSFDNAAFGFPTTSTVPASSQPTPTAASVHDTASCSVESVSTAGAT